MNRIKKFESFGYRMPTEVSPDDFEKKRDIHGKYPFTEKEIAFFKKLEEENSILIHDLDLSIHYCLIQIYEYDSNDRIDFETIENIEIIKLTDDWYLIRSGIEYDPDCFICDEWDEVLGYLKSNTKLNF